MKDLHPTPFTGRWWHVGLVCLAPTAALGQSLLPDAPAPAAEEPWALAPMLITATRLPAEPFDVPYAGDLVGLVQFEERMPRTTPEALRDQPSVMLQKTGHGQGSPYIRGFTGFRTLMLIDGIRLNNSTYRDGPNQYWNTVDSLSLDRLEVVRGPGSALYGSDAIGGTVNALTRHRTTFEPGFHWDGRAYYRFASAEDSHTGRAEWSANQDDRVGISAGASFKAYGDLRGGEDIGLMPESGYSEWDADANVEWRLAPNTRLVFAHQTVDLDDAWRTHATIYGKSWSGTALGTDYSRIFDQYRDLNYLQFHATDLDGFAQELHASLSYHIQNEQEARWRSDRRHEYLTTDVGTLGLSVQARSDSPVGEWVYGAEYYRDAVDSTFRRYAANGTLQTVRRQGPVADDSSYDLAGLYAQDRMPFARDRLEITVGGRLNIAHADASKVEDPFTGAPLAFDEIWSTAVGNGRLLWHVDEADHWNLFAGASQGFRAPNLSDLSRFDIARSGEQEIPAFDLEPEQFVSFEVGAKARYLRFSAEAAFYHTLIDEMIVRVPTGQSTPSGAAIVSKQNSGDGYVQGVELDASVEVMPDWTLWGNFSWMQGRVETPLISGGATQEEPVSRLMPPTVNLGVRWQETHRKFWAEFACTIAGTQDLLSSGDARDTQRIPPGGTPGYEVFHLRAGWRPCQDFTLSLALENLANADYRVHGSGLNEPGRNLVVAADFRF
ncbi:MAG: TonB-dependent receptor [Verrucomicrobiales bacterium]|nr:TonB-dependent receptor [Verrucomicrobiales bacterium]